MVKNSLRILVIISLNFLLSCLGEEINYEFPYNGKKLVLNAWINQNGVDLILGSSQDLNQIIFSEGDTVAFASIWLLDENNQKLSRIPYQGKGRYSLDTLLSVGIGYKLSAEKEGYPNAVSQLVIIPPPVLEVEAIVLGKNDDHYQLSISIKDKSPSQDYYLIAPLEKTDNLITPGSVSTDFDDIYLTQCSISSEEGWIVFGDPCFNNSTFKFPVTLYLPDLPVDSVGFEIGSTSEIFYKYVDSLRQPSILYEQFFSSPNLLKSNVEGGYGIVATRNTRIFWFPF